MPACRQRINLLSMYCSPKVLVWVSVCSLPIQIPVKQQMMAPKKAQLSMQQTQLSPGYCRKWYIEIFSVDLKVDENKLNNNNNKKRVWATPNYMAFLTFFGPISSRKVLVKDKNQLHWSQVAITLVSLRLLTWLWLWPCSPRCWRMGQLGLFYCSILDRCCKTILANNTHVI